MKKIINVLILYFLIVTTSCNYSEHRNNSNLYEAINLDSVMNMKIVVSNNEIDIPIDGKIKATFKETMKINGIWKFKRLPIIITYFNGVKDTIVTNGVTFGYKGYYFEKKNKENIFKKFNLRECKLNCVR